MNLVVVLSPTVTGDNNPGRSANILAVHAHDNEGLIRCGGFHSLHIFFTNFFHAQKIRVEIWLERMCGNSTDAKTIPCAIAYQNYFPFPKISQLRRT